VSPLALLSSQFDVVEEYRASNDEGDANMRRKIGILLMALGWLAWLGTGVPTAVAEDANGNCVIVAGDHWDLYVPPNYIKYGSWPRLTFRENLSARGNAGAPGAWLFRMTRLVTSGYFGNAPWSWPFGEHTFDFDDFMVAVEYNPNENFAALNQAVHGQDNRNYAFLHYNSTIPGANDPNRNYVITLKGSVLKDGRNLAYYEAGWPTQLGVDVKMRVYSWTFPYGSLDNFDIVEYEFYNTGEQDINGDGVVDLHGQRINALVLAYDPTVFSFRILRDGGRTYTYPNSRYIGWAYDASPDENGYPWDITVQGRGSDPGREDMPGIGNDGWYADVYCAYTFLGAKKVDENGNILGNKNLCFKNALGEEVIPAIGEGAQRGWFHTVQSGRNNVNDYTPKGVHICATGTFYVDGGKGRDRSKFDLAPNPRLFSAGTPGDITTFVPKDPGQWQQPSDESHEYGAYMFATPRQITVDGVNRGLCPLDPENGRPLEPGVLVRGVTGEYQFNGNEPWTNVGPFALEVGERIRVYWVRGAGFRLQGARRAIKAARAVYNTMDAKGNYHVPRPPDVPDINVDVSPAVRPWIKWQEVAGADGYKIYKCRAWPRYNPVQQGIPTADTYWTVNPETFDNNGNIEAQQAQPEPYNPLLSEKAISEFVKQQQGEHWGPYYLVHVVKKENLANYLNTDTDKGTYKYAWEDNTPGTLLGFTFYYYVAAYKKETGSIPGLEQYTWLETGKVNVNGRTGLWEGTWPWTDMHAYYPAKSDAAKRKAVGVDFVLASRPLSTSLLATGQRQIQVRPNPYKRAAFHDAAIHGVFFFNLPSECTIWIFDVSGQVVDKIDFRAEDPNNGTYFWDLHSKDGAEVASGIYIWVAEFKGGKQHGVFSILR
jgi:hypothetical protein